MEDSIFGEIIHSYTRADAVSDGVLVDVTPTAKEAGIRLPVALTRAVHTDCVLWTRGGRLQDEAGRLWDVVWMAANAIRRAPPGVDEVRFMVYRVPNVGRGRSPKPVTLRAKVHGGDHGEPVVTIMLPGED